MVTKAIKKKRRDRNRLIKRRSIIFDRLNRDRQKTIATLSNKKKNFIKIKRK